MKETKSSLADRWKSIQLAGIGVSPFGNTEDGHSDFRGFPYFSGQEIDPGIHLQNCDFSYADFSGVWFERAELSECLFKGTIFDNSREKKCVFRRCMFTRCTFRNSALGLGTSYYDDCTLEGNTFSKARFYNAVFRESRFLNNRMSNFFFLTTGFQRCRIAGVLDGISFSGNFLTDEDRGHLGDPVEVGLCNVDVSDATFKMVGFREYYPIRNVVLPRDGSSCLVDAGVFMDRLEKLGNQFPAHKKKIKDYASIFINPVSQPVTICNLFDFRKVIDQEAGVSIYEEVTKIGIGVGF